VDSGDSERRSPAQLVRDMKPQHKVAAGAGGVLVLLSGIMFQVWDRIEARQTVKENRTALQCEIRVCEAKGGTWSRGDCVTRRRRR